MSILQWVVNLNYSWLNFVVLANFFEGLIIFTIIFIILLHDLSLIFLGVLIDETLYNVC
jgi:hypothetical protein